MARPTETWRWEASAMTVRLILSCGVMENASRSRCIECGADVSGRFCSQCGEATTRHDYSLGHAAEELVETVAHVDGRVFSTFRSLITRPGLLAANFLAGRRRSQMGPVQLFFVCNVIYFLIQPFSFAAPFTSTLSMQTTQRPWSAMARRMVEGEMQRRNVSAAEYERRFDEAAHLQGKTLVIIMVPIFALGAWVLFGRTRRFYAEHLVFAFYTYAFLLIWMGVSTPAVHEPVVFMVRHHWPSDLIESLIATFIAVPFAIYLFVAARQTYGESRLRTLFKSAALTGWAIGVLTIYRFILFFTTLHAT
jgi:hypothetical protein